MKKDTQIWTAIVCFAAFIAVSMLSSCERPYSDVPKAGYEVLHGKTTKIRLISEGMKGLNYGIYIVQYDTITLAVLSDGSGVAITQIK